MPARTAASNASANSAIVEQGGPSGVRAYALRLAPGADLRKELTAFAAARNLRAAAVVSAVGSVRRATIRFAEVKDGSTVEGPFEIVSLSGTLSPDGPHLHIALADKTGRTVGGHLLDGAIVNTTAEVVLAELTELQFHRRTNPQTQFPELVIEPRSGDR